LIHQVTPVFVNFAVPEQHLAAIRRLLRDSNAEVKLNAASALLRLTTGTGR